MQIHTQLNVAAKLTTHENKSMIYPRHNHNFHQVSNKVTSTDCVTLHITHHFTTHEFKIEARTDA